MLCYIDDLNKFVYPVDVLIHGGIINKFRPYEKFSESELILAGTEYSLLRPEFKNLPTRKINETISEIMISSGGTDNFNVIPFLIRAFRSISSLNNIKINVIVGSSFNNKEELKSLNTKYPNIVFYENVDHISQIMLKSDVAFSAGGSTIYELMACGTPIISYVIAENQDYIIQKMQEMGCLINMGWHHELDCKSVIKTFNTLKDDYNLRLNLSNYGQQLVDARGPERVVSEILKKQNH
ncbi:MAG: glycosyltransferase [Ignavibacteria bacterium]|nr:glycosyltransferase [Ignavibacteria bacterium]